MKVTKDFQEITVSLADISEPDTPGPALVLIDCLDKQHVNSLVTNPVFEYLFKNEMENEHLNRNYILTDIIHFGDYTVIGNENYLKWVNIFERDVRFRQRY